MTTRRSGSAVLEDGFPRLGGGVPWPPDGEVDADRRGPQQEEHGPEEAERRQVQHGPARVPSILPKPDGRDPRTRRSRPRAAEICDILSISGATVKTHVAR